MAAMHVERSARTSRPFASSLSKYSSTPAALVNTRQPASTGVLPASGRGVSATSQAVKVSAPRARSASPSLAFMRGVPVRPMHRRCSGGAWTGEKSSAAVSPTTMTAGGAARSARAAMFSSVPRMQ